MITKASPHEEVCVSPTSRKERIAATFRLQVARDEQQRREMGARIKELREANGFKQQYVADHCGVQLRTYQMWQAGDTTPDQDNLEKLAALFGVTTKFILRGETPEPLPAQDETTQILARLDAIDEQLRLLRAETAARDAEAQKRIDEGFRTIQKSLRRRPA